MTRTRAPVDAIVTDHADSFRSGVARFNELLASEFRVPLRVLTAQGYGDDTDCPLLSFKFSEVEPGEARALKLILDDAWRGEIYLHEFVGLPLELSAIQKAQQVHCGNAEIHAKVRALRPDATLVWTPGLILDDRRFAPAEISVFSFGMAHKIRVDMFGRLRDLLEDSGRSYAVFVSAANHETASLRDAEIVFRAMQEIFPTSLYFLGNLSDVAVCNYLTSTTFFAAFFPGGVRANNTSVASAMERGAVVITNLDEHSPREFIHMDNIIDLDRCSFIPEDELELRRLSVRAMETGRARNWESLVAVLRGST